MTCVDDEYPLEYVVCPVRRTKQSCVKSQVHKISALSCSLGAVVQLGSCRADSRQRQRSPLQAPYARPARPPPPNEQPVAEGDGLRVHLLGSEGSESP